MTEKELADKAKAGDKDAFCALYGIYKNKLYRYAFYRLGNVQDAQDAVSECVVSAYEQIRNLKKSEAFSSWIFRILYCTCSSFIKQQINQRETENIEDYGNLSLFSITLNTEKTELQEALEILSESEKEIVLLSVIAGWKSREIATVTGMTSGSVRSKLSRSLVKMKNFLE